MTDEATRALDDPDPWDGFARFAETFVQLRATSCGLHDALSSDHDQAIDAEVTRLRQAVGKLVRHAQSAGVLRTDIDLRDVPFVLASAIPADHTIGIPAKQDQWKRNCRTVVLDAAGWQHIVRPDGHPGAGIRPGRDLAGRQQPSRPPAGQPSGPGVVLRHRLRP